MSIVDLDKRWPSTQQEANALATAGGEAVKFLMLRMFDKPVKQWSERDTELLRLIIPLLEDRRMALDFMIAELRTRSVSRGEEEGELAECIDCAEQRLGE